MTQKKDQLAIKKTPWLSWLFLLLLALHAAVVLIPVAFVSHDGPSHLYNAQIVNALLFSDSSIYHTYHAINPNWLQPNLLSYFFLSGFQLLFHFFLAEKLTVVVYMLLLAFGFRSYLRATVLHAEWYAFLIFPFLLNVVLFWGFYNFLFGLGLLFITLAYYEKWRNAMNWQRLLGLVFLSLLVYYSHAMVFVICGIYVAVRELMLFAMRWIRERKFTGAAFINASFMVPGSVLFLTYLANQQTKQEGFLHYSFINRIERLFFKIESLSFAGYSEGSFVVPLFVILFALSILKIAQRWKTGTKGISHFFWVLLIYLAALLFAPDAEAGGSIIVLRLNLIFFLFWLVWLANGPINKGIRVLVLVYTFISLPLLATRYQLIDACSLQAEHVTKLCQPLTSPNTIYSTVYHRPITQFVGDYQVHSYFDLMSNIDQYIALDGACLSLHNYEADRLLDDSYFPIVWLDTALVKTILTKPELGKRSEYINMERFVNRSGRAPDFVLQFGEEGPRNDSFPPWDAGQDFKNLEMDSLGFIRAYGP